VSFLVVSRQVIDHKLRTKDQESKIDEGRREESEKDEPAQGLQGCARKVSLEDLASNCPGLYSESTWLGGQLLPYRPCNHSWYSLSVRICSFCGGSRKKAKETMSGFALQAFISQETKNG
jgi:hypothetical protein